MTRCAVRFGPIAVAASIALAGCASAGRGLKPRDYWPSGQRWKHATMGALRDPGTWAPAAGAALMAMDDWDEEIADWAAETTPLFGSNRAAKDASNALLVGTTAGMVGTALAVEPGPGAWERKSERLGIETVGFLLVQGTTDALKSVTDRRRPDGGDRAFPSGHASWAFVTSTLARRNLDGITLPEGVRRILGSGFLAMASACGWARVEAGVHYPSDVLFGAALGNFFAVFIHDAFLPADSRAQVAAFLGPGEGSVAVAVRF